MNYKYNISTGRLIKIYLEGTGQIQLVKVEIIGNENSSPYSYTWNDLDIGNIFNPRCLSPDIYATIMTDISTGCPVTQNIIVE